MLLGVGVGPIYDDISSPKLIYNFTVISIKISAMYTYSETCEKK